MNDIIKLAENNLKDITKGYSTNMIIRQGRILKDLKSICKYCGVYYLG